MTDLPVCRLCQKDAGEYVTLEKEKMHCCSNDECRASSCLFTEEEWRKLMYVPAKKKACEPFEAFDLGYERGYNAAIDAMERGGV